MYDTLHCVSKLNRCSLGEKKKKNVIFLIFLQVLQKLLLVLKAYFAYIKKSHLSTVFKKRRRKKRDLENYLMRVTDGDTLHYRIYNHTAE